jgi:hypothetical protein
LTPTTIPAADLASTLTATLDADRDLKCFPRLNAVRDLVCCSYPATNATPIVGLSSASIASPAAALFRRRPRPICWSRFDAYRDSKIWSRFDADRVSDRWSSFAGRDLVCWSRLDIASALVATLVAALPSTPTAALNADLASTLTTISSAGHASRPIVKPTAGLASPTSISTVGPASTSTATLTKNSREREREHRTSVHSAAPSA